MTARLIKAIENPYTTMVGHATGRLLLKRDPYSVNLKKVIEALNAVLIPMLTTSKISPIIKQALTLHVKVG